MAEYTGQWGILGVENGSLLLMSTINVTNVTLNGKKDYLTDGTIKLNNACAPYKNELYATKARSVKVEDINRINGYKEPATKEYTYTMVDGHVKRNDQTNPSSQTKFEDIDGKKLPDDVQISIIEDTYSYKFLSNIPSESKAYNLITDKIDNSYAFYWLDNKYVGSYAGDVRWGFRSVIYDGVGGIDNNALWLTYWGNSGANRGARTVIVLKSDIQISETANSEGMYEIN